MHRALKILEKLQFLGEIALYDLKGKSNGIFFLGPLCSLAFFSSFLQVKLGDHLHIHLFIVIATFFFNFLKLYIICILCPVQKTIFALGLLRIDKALVFDKFHSL